MERSQKLPGGVTNLSTVCLFVPLRQAKIAAPYTNPAERQQHPPGNILSINDIIQVFFSKLVFEMGEHPPGNYPGVPRTAAEVRQDLATAVSLLPGTSRVNLHASYGESGAAAVDRDQLRPDHFAGHATFFFFLGGLCYGWGKIRQIWGRGRRERQALMREEHRERERSAIMHA